MKSRQWLVSLGLGFGLTLAALILLGGGARGDLQAQSGSGVIRVATTGADAPGCGSATSACRTVQFAVDEALPGEEVRVAEGIYTDVHAREGLTQVVYISKTVTIRGGYTTTNWTAPYPVTQPTTLNAQGLGRVLYVTGDIQVSVEGLRITGGDATGLGPWAAWDYGGGVYVYDADITLGNCVIVSNTASTEQLPDGGGVYVELSDAVLRDNTICGNSAAHGSNGRGGGLSAYSSNLSLESNTICDNVGAARGGGVCAFSSHADFRDNAIYGNRNVGTGSGGGVNLYSVDASLSGNRIVSNTAAFFGGGLYVEYSQSVLLTNNLVADNYAPIWGSGIFFEASWPHLVHNTIARNTGGDGSGVLLTWDYYANPSIAQMTNTIIVSQTVGIAVKTGSTATLNATLWHANGADWEGNVSHARDYAGDPAFSADGYHLTDASEAIDRGVDAGATTDIDGDARPQGGGFDIGADEFPLPPPDVLWDKRIRVNTGSFEPWDNGPFTVAPGDSVIIEDRVWVTSTVNTSFDLADEWTPSLEWLDYEATAGGVSTGTSTAAWSVGGGSPNAWHVLTKTMTVVTDSGYLDTLSETLVVVGATYQPPARIVEFEHARPEPVWDKMVQVNGGAPAAWDSGPFIAAPGDTITVTDHVSISHWADVSFTLTSNWGSALDLIDWTSSAGVVVSTSGSLAWEATGEAANQQHDLTATYVVVGSSGLRETISETLHVYDAALQPPGRPIELLIAGASPDCHARINDGATTYATVQSAVDAAQAGDLVKVAGRCSALNVRDKHIQVIDLRKNLTLRGGYTTTNWTVPDVAANPTTLDAQGLGRAVYLSGGITATLEGLRITGGSAIGLGGAALGRDAGGGVYALAATVVVSRSSVYSNTAGDGSSYGGGLYVYEGTAIVTGSHVCSNTAGRLGGGGIYVGYGEARVSGNTISGNYGGYGGGLYLIASDATIEINTFSDNRGSFGGGISLDGGTPKLRGNTFTGNRSSSGGGAHVYQSDATFESDIFSDNFGSLGGGGLWIFGQAPELVNAVVVGNQTGQHGAGIYVEAASPRVLHTTVANNTGGDGSGIFVTDYGGGFSRPVLTNTIITSHTVGIHVEADNTASLNGTLWHGNGTDTAGAGSIDTGTVNVYGDPAFAPDGYHITAASAAIDAGVDAGVESDLDGETRPSGAGYDVGADEFSAAPAVVWEKRIRLNTGPLLPWDSGPFTVAPGDAVTVVDRLWITYTKDVAYSLAQAWDGGLKLTGWTNDAGTVVGGPGPLVWDSLYGAAGESLALTTTWQVTGTDWLQGALTETLMVEGADPQPSQRVVSLSNAEADTGCYARINAGVTVFPVVQWAVDAAQPGDLVKVAGTCSTVNNYGGLAQVVYIAKTLTLRGGYTTTNWSTSDPEAYPTILDALGQGRVLYVLGEVSPTIEGFHITGGMPPAPQTGGGGVYVADSSGIFRDNVIYSNTANYGGGIYFHRASTRLVENAILSNTVSTLTGYGGGVYADYGGPTLEGNRIAHNSGSYGAGVYLSRSSGTLAANTISHNAGNRGGGVSLYDGNPELAANLITENSADDGGGLYLHGATAPLLTNNVIVDNETSESGAIYVTWGSAPRLIHTTVARNTGGSGTGVWVAYKTFASTVGMTNTIISSQTVGIHVDEGCSASLEATLWDNVGSLTGGGGVAIIGTVNVHSSPSFASDGYHLTAGSAAIDAGVDAGVVTDIDGDERPYGAGYDLGADEAGAATVFLPLVVRNQ